MHPSPVHSPDALASPACTHKRASISYNPPPRDRSNKQRPLVIVIPPSILLHQYGLLGHTLSLGPSQRLAHGIVMPLYPTMYAQLTAIAREYNFPSTAGLCLYLHHSNNAVTVTPRISDGTWHSLWCPAFDGPPPARVVPILGTIEFDVDLRYARWYPSWLSSSQRDIPDPASDCHRHVDSRTTIYDERADDHRETYMRHPVPSVSSQRHFPKKLSLLENTANTKIPFQSPSPSPEKPFVLAPVLSPIAQKREPMAARQDLRTRVQSWRASAILDSSPIAMAGQFSLEPVNALKIEVSSDNILIPEEYSWSITSAGPDDRESVISVDSERLPSLYIEDRLVGSVCSTSSVCTSFSHFDYDFDSPTRGTHILPSPDIAQRAIKSVPMTTMTTTTRRSENDNCHYPYFNIYPAIYPFFDLYPAAAKEVASTLSLAKNQSPDATYMKQSSHYPYLHIYPAIYPFFDLYPATAGRTSTFSSRVDQSSVDHAISIIQSPNYPYLDIYPAVYPFFDLYPPIAEDSLFALSYVDQPTIDHVTSITQGFRYPYLQIYPAIYPFFNFYPAVGRESSFTSSYVDQPTIDQQIFHYPFLQIYPTVYPFFDLYSAVAEDSLIASSYVDQPTIDHVASITHGFRYPYLQIYPAVYPFFNLYPAVGRESSFTSSYVDQPTINQVTSIVQSFHYPFSQIFVAGESLLTSSYVDQPTIDHVASITQGFRYPYLQIYPAVYPFLDLYPTIARESSSEYSLRITPNTINHTIHLMQSWHYPYLSIYRPVYPFFDLYPALTVEIASALTSFTDQNSDDHVISDTHGLDPASYPFFGPYPFKARDLNIYPAGYPFFDLYPALRKGSFPVSVDHSAQNYHYPYLNMSINMTSINRAVSTTLREYPSFNLYPSCYPFLDIYPGTLQVDPTSYPYLGTYPSIDSQSPAISIHFHLYPVFDLYPALYPHFNLYPTVAGPNPSRIDARTQCNDYPVSNYPALVIYRPVYPHLHLYPSITAEDLDVNSSISPARFCSGTELREGSLKKLGRKKSHQDLHLTVFPDGFVSTPSGTVQPPVESYIVHDTNNFTSMFKAALQVQVINLSS